MAKTLYTLVNVAVVEEYGIKIGDSFHLDDKGETLERYINRGKGTKSNPLKS